MKCAACPCPGVCLGETGDQPVFCPWAASGDPVKVRHVAWRSSLGAAVPPETPSLLQKAVNFAGAVAGHVAAGMPTLDAAATEARLAVCRACPKFTAAGTCSVCGCTNMRLKASWADQDCPEGKWPETP